MVIYGGGALVLNGLNNKGIESMTTKTGLGYSPITSRIYWGRQNTETGVWVGDNKKDVTNEFLQVMEHKFPINTIQNISINGENKYRVIIVDLEKEVVINGKEV